MRGVIARNPASRSRRFSEAICKIENLISTSLAIGIQLEICDLCETFASSAVQLLSAGREGVLFFFVIVHHATDAIRENGHMKVDEQADLQFQ